MLAMPRTVLGWAAAAITMTVVAVCCVGCNIIATAAYVAGPPPVPAEYLPPQTPMLVLVDSGANDNPLDAEQLERHVIAELNKRQIAPLVDGDRIYTMRLEQPEEFNKMAITTLGRLAGASQVLYITSSLSASEVAPGANMIKGYGRAKVRVVDVTTGQTAWPPGASDGYPVQSESRPDPKGGVITANTIRQETQRGLAEEIVRLFYKYRPD